MKLKNKIIALGIGSVLALVGSLSSYSYFTSRAETSIYTISIGNIGIPSYGGDVFLGPKDKEEHGQNNNNYISWMQNVKQYLVSNLIKAVGGTPIYTPEQAMPSNIQEIKVVDSIEASTLSGSNGNKLLHYVAVFGSENIVNPASYKELQLSDNTIKITDKIYTNDLQHTNTNPYVDISSNIDRFRTFKFNEEKKLVEVSAAENGLYDLILYDYIASEVQSTFLPNNVHENDIDKREFSANYTKGEYTITSKTITINYTNGDNAQGNPSSINEKNTLNNNADNKQESLINTGEQKTVQNVQENANNSKPNDAEENTQNSNEGNITNNTIDNETNNAVNNTQIINEKKSE